MRFINGTCKKPENNAIESKKWTKNDYMIKCLLLNLMTKDFAEAFVYAQSVHDLWKDIKENFGMVNEPIVSQL